MMSSQQSAIKDFRAAIKKAAEQHREYDNTNTKVPLPQHPRFKMKIWFKDGNARTFYSWDVVKRKDAKYKRDEWLGLEKLMSFFQSCDKQNLVKTAMIWADSQKICSRRHNFFYPVMKKNFKGCQWNNDLVFLSNGLVCLDSMSIHIAYVQKGLKKPQVSSNELLTYGKKNNSINT